ncbi:hypothetical protein ACFXPQ_10540 [Streptomyces lydicus]|uniref:hypothetical protein n=1 Tax=Streptomyces lydicus TaxID=47763 RepID=UPI0036B4FEFF
MAGDSWPECRLRSGTVGDGLWPAGLRDLVMPVRRIRRLRDLVMPVRRMRRLCDLDATPYATP